MPDEPLPLEFRKEFIEKLIALLRSGESCAVVGVGSSGKSNIARHLARPDVRRHYFQTDPPRSFVVYINCKPYALREPYELYLHMLDCVDQALEEFNDLFSALRPEIRELLGEAQDHPELLANRNLNRGVNRLVRAGAEHIVFLLDDCDDLLTKTPPILFSDLRNLRDNNKVRLVYLTLTRRELDLLRPNTHEFEEFFELFSAEGHTFPVPPLSVYDGKFMIQRLAARQVPELEMSESETERLFELSGGHAGLIRSIFFAAQKLNLFEQTIIEQLVTHVDVETEAKKIWDSLETDEHETLKQLVAHQSASPEVTARLERRGLVKQHDLYGLRVLSPVFGRYIEHAITPHAPRITQIEFLGLQVRINGELIANLLQPEYDLLHHLYDKRPALCSQRELIEVIYRSGSSQRSTDIPARPHERLTYFVEQLRAKLGAAGQDIHAEGDSFRLTV